MIVEGDEFSFDAFSDHILIAGDVMDTLAKIPDESIQCCVTSPPYWSLRDYGAEGQLGLESTPEEYVAKMVQVFREVRRVLKKDGIMFLNLGDCYAGGGRGWEYCDPNGKQLTNRGTIGVGKSQVPVGLKPKDLVGIPWRVAFALQADGWVLRQEIIWFKNNPMPESVRDRCTKSHEQVFMFAKAKWVGTAVEPISGIREDMIWLGAMIDAEGSICINRKVAGERQINPTYAARICCYNTSKIILDRVATIAGAGTVRERNDSSGRMVYQWQVAGPRAVPIIEAIEPFLMAKRKQAAMAIELQLSNKHHGNNAGWGGGAKIKTDVLIERQAALYRGCSELNKTGTTNVEVKPYRGHWTSQPYIYDADAIRDEAVRCGDRNMGDREIDDGFVAGGWLKGGTVPKFRNKRSVWTVATTPFSKSHFATFPPKLIKPMILAGSRPSDIVLDPFVGSGTTVAVAKALGRRAIGIDLKREYLTMRQEELAQEILAL